MGFPYFLGLGIRSFLKHKALLTEGLGLSVENAEELSQKINALGNQEELKQKIESFMQSQSGATDKIVNHTYLN